MMVEVEVFNGFVRLSIPTTVLACFPLIALGLLHRSFRLGVTPTVVTLVVTRLLMIPFSLSVVPMVISTKGEGIDCINNFVKMTLGVALSNS